MLFDLILNLRRTMTPTTWAWRWLCGRRRIAQVAESPTPPGET
jgi:hypothetical protein